ncbi:MAG: outer membrane lipid asymmetry maintenance protein MlaD [Rickettsiales bacterium]|nr:outer membrane lipid asymmetry maintenance protein MlaD [Rickettsiales bacterium]|tara:strand:+ start:21 stop:467 length:447 start_codon:yes stop_codon:yes gene_type:complete
MKRNYFETILGAVILIFSLVALYLFIKGNSFQDNKNNLSLSAKFLKAGGVIAGNDVKLRGVKIGTVAKVYLDDEFLAVVDFYIDEKINLPRDSQVSINNDGLLGGKYLSIIPGTIEKEMFVNDDEVLNVVDYESIEDQVSKIIFLATQ